MIGIINYGSGNIQAIGNILTRANIPYNIVSVPEELEKAERIILPGVGSFDQAMNELKRSGLKEALDHHVLEKGKLMLGICVGMQLLANSSEEGIEQGLGYIPGKVLKFDHAFFTQQTHLPHMGWNEVNPVYPSPLFNEVDRELGYYFLHSYYFSCSREEDVLTKTCYGIEFASAVNHRNIFGVQFHPEKSHQPGIQLLKNFATL